MEKDKQNPYDSATREIMFLHARGLPKKCGEQLHTLLSRKNQSESQDKEK